MARRAGAHLAQCVWSATALEVFGSVSPNKDEIGLILPYVRRLYSSSGGLGRP